jgi:hypothetical protein
MGFTRIFQNCLILDILTKGTYIKAADLLIISGFSETIKEIKAKV